MVIINYQLSVCLPSFYIHNSKCRDSLNSHKVESNLQRFLKLANALTSPRPLGKPRPYLTSLVTRAISSLTNLYLLFLFSCFSIENESIIKEICLHKFCEFAKAKSLKYFIYSWPMNDEARKSKPQDSPSSCPSHPTFVDYSLTFPLYKQKGRGYWMNLLEAFNCKVLIC